MSAVTSWENALLVMFRFLARPWNSLRSSFVWADKFRFSSVQNPVKANFAFEWVTISLNLNFWISFKMWRNKCAKFVFRAQWLVTVGSSWEVVGDSSLVQCKTRFVQIFHIFFFMEHIFVDPSPKLVPRSRSVLRRGRSGYEITSTFSLTHLSIIYEYLLFCHN